MPNGGQVYCVGPEGDPDKYRLRRQIGGGGEAELREAEVSVGGAPERVALKILCSEHLADLREWRRRWDEQVELLRLLRHPGVVGVHAQFTGAPLHTPGTADPSQGEVLYLVMNWVEGKDLRDWLPRHTGPEHHPAVMRVLGQVAAVLDWLHSGRATPSGRLVVHCDITPANVVVNADGQAVLVDFGLVRITRHVTANVFGTWGYAAPEVVGRGEYTPASDRYVFGALCFFALTGAGPSVDPGRLRDDLGLLAPASGMRWIRPNWAGSSPWIRMPDRPRESGSSTCGRSRPPVSSTGASRR